MKSHLFLRTTITAVAQARHAASKFRRFFCLHELEGLLEGHVLVLVLEDVQSNVGIGDASDQDVSQDALVECSPLEPQVARWRRGRQLLSFQRGCPQLCG